MNHHYPLVSIIIRTTGRQQCLDRALTSISQQVHPNIETIVVEDGPPSLARFMENYPLPRLRYHPLGERKGRSAAGNKGLELAQGQYVLFLDDDDVIFPSHISSLVKCLHKNNASVCYSFSEEQRATLDNHGRILKQGKKYPGRIQRFSLYRLLHTNFLPINAVLFRRSLYEELGGLDTQLDALEDWDLWLRFASKHAPFACTGMVTCLYVVPASHMEYARRRKAILQSRGRVLAKLREIFPEDARRGSFLQKLGLWWHKIMTLRPLRKIAYVLDQIRHSQDVKYA